MTNRDPWFDIWTTRIRGECDGAGALLTSDKVTELLHNLGVCIFIEHCAHYQGTFFCGFGSP